MIRASPIAAKRFLLVFHSFFRVIDQVNELQCREHIDIVREPRSILGPISASKVFSRENNVRPENSSIRRCFTEMTSPIEFLHLIVYTQYVDGHRWTKSNWVSFVAKLNVVPTSNLKSCYFLYKRMLYAMRRTISNAITCKLIILLVLFC